MSLMDDEAKLSPYGWLNASEVWKRNIEYVSIDMSDEFRKAIYVSLPEVNISVDDFHIVQRTHHKFTAVQQRGIPDLHGCRGWSPATHMNEVPISKHKTLLFIE